MTEFLPPNQYSALTLAYIGDCVYELHVRSHLISDVNKNVNNLHHLATKYVCAAAQAEFFRKVEGILTDDELAVYKRGRNTKSHVPKNADMADYRSATGVEALIGHLYISGNSSRINELLTYIWK